MIDEIFGPLLGAYLASALPGAASASLTHLERAAAGWESEIWLVQLDNGQEYALRLYPGRGDAAKAAREYHVIQALNLAGYPTPKVYLLEEGALLSRPFVLMEVVRGSSLWPLLANPPASRQQEMFALFARLFVQLHLLDPGILANSGWVSPPPSPELLVEATLAGWQAHLEALPIPGIVPVWNWLQERLPRLARQPASLVHFDFHPENILVRPDGRPAVIDWTGLQVTDARFDLSWSLLLAASYSGVEMRARLLQAYEQQAGASVRDLDFFETAACLRRLFSILASVKYGAEKLGMRAGAEQIMVQQVEPLRQVYALLQGHTGLTVPEVEAILGQG